MTLLLRALLLGYGSAAFGSAWLQDWAGIWVAVLVAWIGGGVLTLVFAWIGAWLRPPREILAPGAAEFRVARPERNRATGQAGRPGSSPVHLGSGMLGSG